MKRDNLLLMFSTSDRLSALVQLAAFVRVLLSIFVPKKCSKDELEWAKVRKRMIPHVVARARLDFCTLPMNAKYFSRFQMTALELHGWDLRRTVWTTT